MYKIQKFSMVHISIQRGLLHSILLLFCTFCRFYFILPIPKYAQTIKCYCINKRFICIIAIIMEVTRKNFKELLPEISASIKKADFLVVDAEFTGLINGRDVSIFDNPAEYYNRLLRGSTEFLLIQYGLCAFFWDEKEKHYMNDAYNFYLFPRGRPGPERMFLCQSSSLDFLSAQGFDFNKLIKEGISYMTEPIETRLRENLTERQKTYSRDKDTKPIPVEHKQFIEDTCKKIRQFIDENKSDEMEIDQCNAFVRLLLFQEVKIRFKDELLAETKILENKNRVLKVIRVKSAEDTKNHDLLKKEKEWEELEDAVGFSKVARMISQSDKLVVGHNMLLDVIHTLNHFFQPLPPDYDSFKEFAHCMFPRLLDTKYMSSLPPFKDKVMSSVLQHLLTTLSEPPFSLPKVGSSAGRGYTLSADKQHEAGYDAYITGLCFLAMHAHLSRMRGESHCRLAAHSAVVKPFLNKLFLSKTAHQDSSYMNLDGTDPTPSRDHVFHLTFPKEWQRAEINQLFSPFGPITVQFVDDTSALVALSRREQARVVAAALARNARVKLIPYNKYKIYEKIPKRVNEETDVDKLKRTCAMGTTELKAQQAIRSTRASGSSSAPPSPQTPEKARMRCNSVSSSPTLQPARKRTSSGVFQVDESEPPPKKTEFVRSNSEGARKGPEIVANGRLKSSESADGDKEKVRGKSKEKKVMEKFDSDAKSECVSAFKESDTWD